MGLLVVRQWKHGLRQLLGACGWFFPHFLRDGILGSCGRFRALLMLQLLPCVGHTWKLDTTFYEPHCIWQFPVRCLGVLFMAQCLVQQWIHVTRQLLVLLEDFLREGELES